MAPVFRWDHPLDWLNAQIDDCESLANLKGLARALAGQLDGDQIQDLFQAEMDRDGYFDPLDPDESLTVQIDDDPEPVTLAALLLANAHDPDLYRAVRALDVGEWTYYGGGAAAEFRLTRRT